MRKCEGIHCDQGGGLHHLPGCLLRTSGEGNRWAGYGRGCCFIAAEVLDYGDADQQIYTRAKKIFFDYLRIGTFFFALIVEGSYAPSIILFMAVASFAYNTSRATGGRRSGGIFCPHCDHPLYVECMKEGRYVNVTDVAHMVSQCENQAIFWDERNWQPLRHQHHSMKDETRGSDSAV